MQRLNRLRADRGAVAVWVAIMMVPLMIVAALAIDVAGMHTDRQRLQTGADAAALAIAQECAAGDCSDADLTAQELATANDPFGGGATGTVIELDAEAGWVEVQTSSERDHWFAPVIGQDDASLAAVGAASWGWPTGGQSMLPIAFSWCEIAEQTGVGVLTDPATGAVIGLDIPETLGSVYIETTKTSETTCTGPSDNVVPGGFGWIDTVADCVTIEMLAGGWVGSDSGASPPNTCEPDDFEDWIGETLLLPVFEAATGTGGNAEYQIFGFIAFTLEEYSFVGQYTYPTSDAPCSGNTRCVVGTFERFIDLDSAFDSSPVGAQLGTAVVELRLPSEG